MKYRVTFRERFDMEGEPSENPPAFVDLDLREGVVEDAQFIERTKPESMHVQEVLDEDDSFLSIGTEVWEYDITDGREREFEEAMQNSRMVVEFERLDTQMIGGSLV